MDIMIKLTAPNGKMTMKIMKLKELSSVQKLMLAIISAKQGETKNAKLTKQMIADALQVSERYVTASLTKMRGSGLLNKINSTNYSVVIPLEQYGMIELDMLITTNLSSKAKYLYLIYCVVGNKDYDANIWSSKGVCADFHIGMVTYQEAHKELISKGILSSTKRASYTNIQTSNMNVIIRSDKYEIQRPASWAPIEPFSFDAYFKDQAKTELSEPKTELSEIEKGTESITTMELGIERIVTINSNLNNNLNSKTNTNEGLQTLRGSVLVEDEVENKDELMMQLNSILLNEIDKLKKALSSGSDFDISNIEFSTLEDILLKKSALRVDEDSDNSEMDIDMVESLLKVSCKTPQEALIMFLGIIYDAKAPGMMFQLWPLSTVPQIVEKAFKAFDVMKDALNVFGIDATGYGLNFDDILKFHAFYERNPVSEEKIAYHVHKMVELGITREKKKYISFSYVFSQLAELKQDFNITAINSGISTNNSVAVSDDFMYDKLV